MDSLGIFFHSAETILTFLLVGILGYHLAKIGWFNSDASTMFSRLLTKIVIPCNLFCNIQASMTKQDLIGNAGMILVALVSVLLALGVGWLVAGLAKLPRSHRAIFIANFACSNTINIGLPVNSALFGDAALPPILMYYMANTIAFWVICSPMLAADSETREAAPVLSLTTVKSVFSPPLLAFIFGTAFLFAGISMPKTIGNAMGIVADLVTPVSIMCIGISIYETGIKNIRLDREILLLCAGRFVASPLILAGLLHFLPAPELTYKVFIIQSSLPPPASVALLAIYYQTDAKYASVSISFTTLCALVTVPIYMMILG